MNIEAELNNKEMKELFEAILKLENQVECKNSSGIFVLLAN